MVEYLVLTVPVFLSPATRAALDRLRHLDDSVDAGTPADDAVGLDRLRAIRMLRAALDSDDATLDSVRQALRGGADWAQIAEAAGLNPAAAKWRWQGTDAEIAERAENGRQRAARPSSVPTDLPGLSVAETAVRLGVTVQAVYLRITRKTLTARTVQLADGRSYKRVFLDEPKSL